MTEIHSPIQQFYAGQNVFLTGGTGFLGKILIEKLLRTTEVASIYMLVRPKKGQNVLQRLETFFDDPIFQRLKDEVPKFLHKVVAVAGDCSRPGLDLSAGDITTLLREISIVFNVAATVRFDEKIQDAVAINIQGTKETLNLCRCMENLKAVVHVSTAYSNCNKNVIEEKIYDSPLSGDDLLQLVKITDNDTLESMTPSLLGDFPNTYTYTKQIAEQVVSQYGKDLPIGVFRPAIVISTYKEPIEGWIDNVFGPTGALVGTGMGLIRTLHLDKSCTAELVPVDYTVNALIASAWDVANNKKNEAAPPIYNYHSTWNNKITWGEYMEGAMRYGKIMPCSKSLWCYSLTPVNNIVLYYILSFLLHIIPAFFVDIGCIMTGQKLRLLKLYKKIHKFLTVTTFFSTRSWELHNETTRNLWNNLTAEDKKLYYFSMDDFDWEDFLQKCITGIRTITLKDDLSTVPVARKRMAKFLIAHKAIKYGFFGFVGYLLWLCIAPLSNLSSFMTVSTVTDHISVA